ncbi:MAG TPA: aspartate aminotransferase family protein [Azospirillaceae bacterium]|nr:aspartate aminotransferase family protein [Azospirillaceae bacterium]
MPQTHDAFWMPFTANRQFRRKPRMLATAEGQFYRDADGRQILDATAGLWCVNAGHARPRIVEAIARQAGRLDYAPCFQLGHSGAFELAERLVRHLPAPLTRVFYTNSGSEAVETALKIALAYHRARGDGHRTRLVGRERGYHGTNFGGMSVGGIVANRRSFGAMLPGVDHMRHTHLPDRNAFSRGQPEHGMELADDLERLVQLHGGDTIAAVIVEPVAGSTGVLVPPKGYLERLREICTRHGILLIFDEVITGFGRLGAPFAAQRFGVTPDLMTVAKGLTNGAVPMGAVFVAQPVQEAILNGPEHLIEFFHGYTYSGHPLACAAALATLDVMEEEALFTRSRTIEALWEERLHGLRNLPHVVDIRNIGLIGAIELAPRDGQPAQRASAAFAAAFEAGLLIRTTGDTIALSPPLILEEDKLHLIFDRLATVLLHLD